MNNEMLVAMFNDLFDFEYLFGNESNFFFVLFRAFNSFVDARTCSLMIILLLFLYSDEELNGFKIPAGSHVVPLINR
jgi:hypothetical protein